MVDQDLETFDLTLGNLSTPDALIHMGVLCSQALLKFGSVTLYVDEDGGINLANPVGVFLNSGVVKAPDREPKFVRPILMQSRPQYVAMREGTLWEVEYPLDEEG